RLRALQVGNRSRNPQHAVVRPCAETEAFNCAAQQRGAGRVQFAVRPDVADAHLGIARDGRMFGESAPLARTGGGDPVTDRQGAFTWLARSEFVELHTQDLEVQVNAIENGT